MRNFCSVILALATVLVPATGMSHHSFSLEFDVGRPVEVTGTVTRIEWTNPHAWLHMDVKDEEGNLKSWAIELLGINVLVRAGVTPKTVKKGDLITITGYGARNGTNTANAASIIRTETGETLWASARNR